MTRTLRKLNDDQLQELRAIYSERDEVCDLLKETIAQTEPLVIVSLAHRIADLGKRIDVFYECVKPK